MLFVVALLSATFATAAPYDVPIDPPVSTGEVVRFEVQPYDAFDVPGLFPIVVVDAPPAPPAPVVEREREPETPIVRVPVLHRATGARPRPAR